MSPLAPLFKVAFHQRRASRFARPPRVRRRRPPKLLELLAHNPSAYRPQRTRPKYASTLVLIRTISVARRDRRRRRTTNQQARHAPQLRKLRLEVLRVREHRGEDPVQLVGPRRGLLRAILVVVRAFRVLLQPRVLGSRLGARLCHAQAGKPTAIEREDVSTRSPTTLGKIKPTNGGVKKGTRLRR